MLNLNRKRPHVVIDAEDDEEVAESKKSHIGEACDLKKQFLLANMSSIGESFERRKKFIVIQNR